MTTVPQTPTPRKAVHSAHRRAFGPGKHRTAQDKARDVAASIAQRHDRGDTWTWATYGLDGNPAQQALVEAALAQLEGLAAQDAQQQAQERETEQARLEAWEALQDHEVHGRW
jgi:hypothetical protein